MVAPVGLLKNSFHCGRMIKEAKRVPSYLFVRAKSRFPRDSALTPKVKEAE